ncbi:hypothetical protein UFOVP328_219 [uncultured Caudovirales phage]|uniref:Nucleotide-diphospho-sugar transferase n=1 Tax=uncultured Caudovirales phage TaxID=2100421 RepID=A0A6J5LYN9_9CAUD|nr:hypothetical protein UFOVP328_219 [uncultured Caudovirales phage]
MTTGALIFAFNNESIDYVSMAAWSAKNIQRHLGIPVSLVTDTVVDHAVFDQVIYTSIDDSSNTRHFSDVGNVTWHNLNRMDAYSLTPYNQTLVLDADYVVASDQLKSVLNSQQDFMCHRTAYDVTGVQTFEDLNVFGRYGFPMWWATVMMFRNSERARLIFESMSMIRDNWTHYRNLYANPRSTYRNDHALSIALNIENGHTLETTDIPWDLASLTPEHRLTQLDQDQYRVDFVTPDQRPGWIKLTQDFHAMGKQQLGDIVANNS